MVHAAYHWLVVNGLWRSAVGSTVGTVNGFILGTLVLRPVWRKIYRAITGLEARMVRYEHTMTRMAERLEEDK
jgi:cytochrome b